MPRPDVLGVMDWKWPLIVIEAERLQAFEIFRTISSLERWMSVSSMRRMSLPPLLWANSQSKNAGEPRRRAKTRRRRREANTNI